MNLNNNNKKNSVYVMTRIKPPLSFRHKTTEANNLNMKELVVKNEKLDYQNKKKIEKKKYNLDKVFDIDYSNADIFECIGIPLVHRFFNYKNSCFFVYGQTGSGKTHTSIGADNEKGLMEYLLQALSKKNRFNKQYEHATISCVQLYNNKFYDIFNDNKEMSILEDHNGKFILKNCKNYLIKDTENNFIMNILKNERKVGLSSENDKSSRSHLIIQINGKNCFMTIIDMAGSEKASKSLYISKDQMKENAKINESILALKECIRAYKQNKKHIPFRKNNLTKVLKNVFYSDCLCYILSTISPDKHNISDTINTLNYVSDMKHIHRTILQIRKTNERLEKINEEYDDEMLIEKKNKLICEYNNELKYNAKNRDLLFNNDKINTIFRKKLKDCIESDLLLLDNMLKLL